MAIRSVVDIDINDGRFKEFSSAFEKYQALLAKTPGAWANMDKGMKSGFSTLSSALLAQLDIINKTNKAEQDLTNTSNKTAAAWRDVSKSTKSVLTNIKDTTISLFKWASIGSIFTGLLGAGSLFGLSELAAGVGATRRQTLGIGTTFGEKKAFDVNYGRIVDSDSYLSNVNASLHDVTKRSALYSAGLSDSDISGKDTAQVGLALIPKLKELADKANPALLGQVLQARQLDKFISLEDFERLRNTSKSELGGYAATYGRDVKTLGQDEKTQRAWQDFSVQLSRAGGQIENIFVTKLTALVGPLDKFSDSIVKSISSFVDSPAFDKWIKSFADGIESAAKYIGSDKFQNDMRTFATDVGLVADALVRGLKTIGVIPKTDEEQKKDNPWGQSHFFGLYKTPYPEDVMGTPNKSAPSDSGAQQKPLGDGKGTGNNYANAPGVLSGAEKKYGLPKGLLWNAFGAESGYGAHLKSPAGAVGPLGFLPNTAKQYGLTDPMSIGMSADAAGRYYTKLLKEFHGDIRKAVAAYNWGEGNVEKDIKIHGADWDKGNNLPKETRDYLDRVLDGKGLSKGVALKLPADYRSDVGKVAGVAQSGPQSPAPKYPKPSNAKVDITINNPAGANVIVTASQLPQ